MKRKYSKCECCPHYGRDADSKRWACSRAKCLFADRDADERAKALVIDRWIEANKGGAE